MNKFIKQLFKATFIQLVAFFMIIGSLAVFALSYPTSNPSGEIPGGVFMNYLNKILVDTGSTTDGTVKKAEVLTTGCNEGEYLQGFDVDGNKICKSIADLANPISADEFSNDVSGWLNYSIISATTPCPAGTVDLGVRTGSINWLLNGDKDMLASGRDTPSTSADHYYFHTSNFNNFRAPGRLCGFNKNINYVIINSTTSCPAGTLDFGVRETTGNWIVIQPVKTGNTIALPRDTPSTSSNYYRDDTYTTSVACDSGGEGLCYTTVPVAYAFQAPGRLCGVDKSYKFIIIGSTEDCTTGLDFGVREITGNWLTSIDGKFTTVWDTPSTNSTYYSTDTDGRFRAPGRLCGVGKYTNFVILPGTYACPAGTINFGVREAVGNWLLKSKGLPIARKNPNTFQVKSTSIIGNTSYNLDQAAGRLCGVSNSIKFTAINSTTACPTGTIDFGVREITGNWFIQSNLLSAYNKPSTSADYYMIRDAKTLYSPGRICGIKK